MTCLVYRLALLVVVLFNLQLVSTLCHTSTLIWYITVMSFSNSKLALVHLLNSKVVFQFSYVHVQYIYHSLLCSMIWGANHELIFVLLILVRIVDHCCLNPLFMHSVLVLPTPTSHFIIPIPHVYGTYNLV